MIRFIMIFTAMIFFIQQLSFADMRILVEKEKVLLDGQVLSSEMKLLSSKESWEVCYTPNEFESIDPDSVGIYKSVSIDSEIWTSFQVSSGYLKPKNQYCVDLFADSEENIIKLSVDVQKRQFVSDREKTDVHSEMIDNGGTHHITEVLFLLPHKYDRNGDGVLGNTVIGIYPDELSENAPAPVQRNKDAYLPPTDFYEITPETEDKFISKYARLGEFAPETVETDSNRMAAIDFELLKVWDAFHDDMKELGYDINGPRILRGYVSPQDRMRMQRLGIELAEFTRFQYGDAIAVIYDQNKDYRMDDLNEDGKIDVEDARALSEIIRDTMSENNLYGGVGVSSSFEGPNHIGTPYVHVDLRGWNLNWEE